MTLDELLFEFLVAAALSAWQRRGLHLSQRLALREFFMLARLGGST